MSSLLQILHASRQQVPNLRGRFLFLSASFPSFKRHPEFRTTTDTAEISNAVVSLAKAVFQADGGLVFGGHPTITPLLLSVARDLFLNPPTTPDARPRWSPANGPRLLAYQSHVFDFIRPKEIGELAGLQEGLGRIVETEIQNDEPQPRSQVEVRPDLQKFSLEHMRLRMLTDPDVQPVAAIYIGGMQGIHDEFQLAHSRVTRRYVIAAPGGAAASLEPVGPQDAPTSLLHDLKSSRLYPHLAAQIVSDVAKHLR